MSKITAIIPSIGRREEIFPLLKNLSDDGIEVLTITRPEVRNIHKLWNLGARIAIEEFDADYLAILNDDIRLPDKSISTIVRTMIENDIDCMGVDPRARFGIGDKLDITYVDNDVAELMLEITTWCFVVKASSWVEIDEEYQWWWGVGDLFIKIRDNGGKLAQLVGLGIYHLGSGSANNALWTKKAIQEDGILWRKKHK